MSRAPLVLAIATAVAFSAAARAADGPDLTLYRADGDALFHAGDGAVDDGYAVVHERRSLRFADGTQDLVIGNLPAYLDPEAVSLNLPAGAKLHLISQRLLLARGQQGTLTGHLGRQISVIGQNGQTLAEGKLVRVSEDGSLVIGGDVFGPTIVRDYAAVKLTGGEVGGGSRLELRVKADGSGSADATLTYPTSGIGWRAAYTGTLQAGDSCRMQFKAQASIANRSGRDWQDASLKLVAGQPQFAKSGGGPRPMAAMDFRAKAESASMPQQSTLDAYRSFTLPGAVNLPDASVTLTPLYAPRTIDCNRTWRFENGGTWQPPKPMTQPDFGGGTGAGSIASTLRFKAFDTLPAGYLRVLTVDHDGNAEFLGESNVADTPKGRDVDATLGTAFDLRGERERTSFDLNKSARQMDEGYRITLTNAGSDARTVTVVEHPNRWRNWELTSSSTAPARTTPDTLEFKVRVPGGGKATLDYTVRYSWTADDD